MHQNWFWPWNGQENAPSIYWTTRLGQKYGSVISRGQSTAMIVQCSFSAWWPTNEHPNGSSKPSLDHWEVGPLQFCIKHKELQSLGLWESLYWSRAALLVECGPVPPRAALRNEAGSRHCHGTVEHSHVCGESPHCGWRLRRDQFRPWLEKKHGASRKELSLLTRQEDNRWKPTQLQQKKFTLQASQL